MLISAVQQSDSVIHGLPCGSAGKESACNMGDLGSIPGFGRSPGEGKGYPLQYFGLENSMDWLYSPRGWKELDMNKWLSLSLLYIYIYIYTYIYVFISFPLRFITGYWIKFPVLYRRSLLFTHPIYITLHLLIPNSQFFPSPPQDDFYFYFFPDDFYMTKLKISFSLKKHAVSTTLHSPLIILYAKMQTRIDGALHRRAWLKPNKMRNLIALTSLAHPSNINCRGLGKGTAVQLWMLKPSRERVPSGCCWARAEASLMVFWATFPPQGVGFPSCPSLFLPVWMTSPSIGIPHVCSGLTAVPESQQKIGQTAPTFLCCTNNERLSPCCHQGKTNSIQDSSFVLGDRMVGGGKQRSKGWPGCHLRLAMWAWENHLIWSATLSFSAK